MLGEDNWQVSAHRKVYIFIISRQNGRIARVARNIKQMGILEGIDTMHFETKREFTKSVPRSRAWMKVLTLPSERNKEMGDIRQKTISGSAVKITIPIIGAKLYRPQDGTWVRKVTPQAKDTWFPIFTTFDVCKVLTEKDVGKRNLNIEPDSEGACC